MRDRDDIDDDDRRAAGRGAIANGRLMPSSIDGRSQAARRYRDVVREFTDQFEQQAGREANAAESQLLRRAAALALKCEAFEARLARGDDDADDADYTRDVGQFQRCLRALGLAGANGKKRSTEAEREATAALSERELAAICDDYNGAVTRYGNFRIPKSATAAERAQLEADCASCQASLIEANDHEPDIVRTEITTRKPLRRRAPPPEPKRETPPPPKPNGKAKPNAETKSGSRSLLEGRR